MWSSRARLKSPAPNICLTLPCTISASSPEVRFFCALGSSRSYASATNSLLYFLYTSLVATLSLATLLRPQDSSRLFRANFLEWRRGPADPPVHFPDDRNGLPPRSNGSGGGPFPHPAPAIGLHS